MIGFATPWILSALVLLPAIWWLLRVTPPAPKLMRFPAIRLLRDLAQREETPARTPLWLLIMRLLLGALLIVSLAGPILRPSAAPPGRGPEIIVVDNGWAAADLWPSIRDAMLAEIDRAERAGMTVVLLPTARPYSGDPVAPLGPLPAGEARRTAEGLEPMPWAADRAAAAQMLTRFDGRSSALWLSDGVEGAGKDELAGAVAGFAAPRIRVPADIALPYLIFPPEAGQDLTVKVRRAVAGPNVPVTVVAHGNDGRLLGTAKGAFTDRDPIASLRLDLPVEVRNEIARIDVEGARNVGSTVLLDERWRRRSVGIVTSAGSEEPNELLSDSFYLKKALVAFAEVSTGPLKSLLDAQPAVLILTDAVSLSAADRRDVSAWVAKGGLLLRLAGPRLAAADPIAADPLLPSQLRTGGRSLSGTLAWTEPAVLAPFPDSSPFFGLDLPKDVAVKQQILAEPSVDLDKKVWARLVDGTPLITADKHERGEVVLIHTNADPTWSNLGISGLFPQMLRRIVSYSAGVIASSARGTIEPFRVLDGFARLQAPGGAAKAIASESFAGTAPSPQHPAGFYGDAEARRALNLTQTLAEIEPLKSLPSGISREAYAASEEVSLAPILLALTMLLAIADTVVALWLGGTMPKLPRPGRGARTAAATVALLLFAGWAHAQGVSPNSSDARLAQAAAQVTLGYVVTGDEATDRVSHAGLDGLASELIRRTSIDHATSAEVNLERDELSVYPLLYWPVAATSRRLSDQAKEKLNHYLATGGMVLIDTRAGAVGAASDIGKLIEGIDIPALVHIQPGHILTKSFFLLNEFPGRLTGGDLWVERDQDAHNDGVSSVVVGGADWAGAWALTPSGLPMFSIAPGGERQRDMAYRFGVNIVMYALTGNYKNDLVHERYIKERLGQ